MVLSRALVVLFLTNACCGGDSSSSSTTTTTPTSPDEPSCQLVSNGHGSAGTVAVEASVVASGLEVPWALAFLPNGDALVTERPGRVRLLRGGVLVASPVAVVPALQSGESGLLGLAIDPRFAENRAFFVYYTTEAGNRIVRYVMDVSGLFAREDRVILDGIPGAAAHDGGRLRFGPDRMLYAATGDARVPSNAQDGSSVAGKILRLSPDGGAPSVFVLGIRNVQAFDWLDDARIVIADHGPTGDLGRFGHDEVSVARAGDNLGWPATWRCDQQPGRTAPLLVFEAAVPPGGGVFYRGDAVPGWKNSFLMGTLGSKHLHRVVIAPDGLRVVHHEIYLEGEPPAGFGRLRDVVQGPDGAVYVTTSNCDGRGTCPATRDQILRITQR